MRTSSSRVCCPGRGERRERVAASPISTPPPEISVKPTSLSVMRCAIAFRHAGVTAASSTAAVISGSLGLLAHVHQRGARVGDQRRRMSKSRLVITAVVLEGRSQHEVVRASHIGVGRTTPEPP